MHDCHQKKELESYGSHNIRDNLTITVHTKKPSVMGDTAETRYCKEIYILRSEGKLKQVKK